MANVLNADLQAVNKVRNQEQRCWTARLVCTNVNTVSHTHGCVRLSTTEDLGKKSHKRALVSLEKYHCKPRAQTTLQAQLERPGGL